METFQISTLASGLDRMKITLNIGTDSPYDISVDPDQILPVDVSKIVAAGRVVRRCRVSYVTGASN